MARNRSFDWNAVNSKIKEMDTKKSFGGGDEDVYYKPKTDDQGNAMVLIRFLPPHPEEDLPFVKKYNHGFQSVNGWYIEDCPTTVGKDCPVCKYNGTQWEHDKEGVRARKRRVNFYSNILVVKDPLCPANEGQVFKYRYGIKIHDKIMEKVSPESEIDDPVNVFDYDNGANFKLKIKSVNIPGYKKPVPNYDASSFSESSIISLNGQGLTDDEINELDGKLNKLSVYTDPKSFKSYEDLAKNFLKKTGIKIPLTADGAQPAAAPAAPVREEIQEAPKEVADFKTPVANDEAFVNADKDETDEDFFAKLRGE
jgi:hypothetical protein|tara:strand:+ start:3463 stop:4395 length:933 start_codon:yes stop_codon:yes gene_type:complete